MDNRLRFKERGKKKRKEDLADYLKVSYQTICNMEKDPSRIWSYASKIIEYIDKNIEPTDHLTIEEAGKEHTLTIKTKKK
mgnify:CR=1 FL=1